MTIFDPLPFSECTERVPCEGCITEKKGCTGCGSNIIGKIGGNIISQITEVESANACLQQCENEHQCKFYSYFDASHESYAKRCLLLSNILGPFTPCEECFTGKNMTKIFIYIRLGKYLIQGQLIATIPARSLGMTTSMPILS